MKLTKYCSIVLLFYCFIVLLSGCETIKEGAKGFLGISTRSLEEARKDAIAKTFNYDYTACYAMVQDILEHMHAYTYSQSKEKHMIAIYVSKIDTTPVGIFFKEIDKANTQVEVSSRSTYAKEFVSGKISSILDKKLTLNELEAQTNAKEAKEAKGLK